jgi:hypothetical protein
VEVMGVGESAAAKVGGAGEGATEAGKAAVKEEAGYRVELLVAEETAVEEEVVVVMDMAVQGAEARAEVREAVVRAAGREAVMAAVARVEEKEAAALEVGMAAGMVEVEAAEEAWAEAG